MNIRRSSTGHIELLENSGLEILSLGPNDFRNGYDRCFRPSKSSNLKYLWPDGQWKKEMYCEFNTEKIIGVLSNIVSKDIINKLLIELVLWEVVGYEH